MKRIDKSSTKLVLDKNLIIFSSGILLFAILAVILLQKFSPILADVIYYCQSYISSISIPQTLRFLLLIIIVSFLTHAILRLSISLSNARSIKKKFLKKEIDSEAVNKLLERLELKDKVKVVESKKLFAFCLGLKNPKIYLSRRLIKVVTEEELEAILRHERYHLKNRDSLVMLAALMCEALLPFFPVLSDVIQNYRIEREVKADREAIRGIGKSYPVVFALKKLLKTEIPPQPGIASMAEQDTFVPRIKALVQNEFQFRRFKKSRLLTSFVSLLILGVIILVPTQAGGHDEAVLCVNEKSLESYSISEYENYSPNKNFSQHH